MKAIDEINCMVKSSAGWDRNYFREEDKEISDIADMSRAMRRQEMDRKFLDKLSKGLRHGPVRAGYVPGSQTVQGGGGPVNTVPMKDVKPMNPYDNASAQRLAYDQILSRLSSRGMDWRRAEDMAKRLSPMVAQNYTRGKDGRWMLDKGVSGNAMYAMARKKLMNPGPAGNSNVAGAPPKPVAGRAGNA